MAKEINDGGNAFPISVCASPSGDVYHSHQVVESGGGMSLRDYFAAAALSGFTSSMEYMKAANELANKRKVGVSCLLAESAYEDADAMLVERSKQ